MGKEFWPSPSMLRAKNTRLVNRVLSLMLTLQYGDIREFNFVFLDLRIVPSGLSSASA